ncbi:MAG: tRNA pseudouridine(55) synthase TruB [Bacteroidales bacterium]|nr:tRNA pseudouridine(55) synthase TruB [Bacteroidales bacterium]
MDLETLLDGVVIPVDKPRQWTSFQAVNKIKSAIRNHYGIKKKGQPGHNLKIGHAGTLDPLATGLLLVCVGKATKSIPQLQDGEKVYSGTMVLGATTPCYDLERPIDARYPYSHITPDLLESTRRQFLGDIEQVPPIFSAVKIGGQRAYQLARQQDNSDTPSPTPKTVHIHDFQITAFRKMENGKWKMENSLPHPDNWLHEVADPSSQFSIPNTQLYKNPLGTVPPELPQIDFRIHCGKGTYIRSIARDFGLALDSGAFLASLRREQVGRYTLADAIPLEKIDGFFGE